MAKGDDLQERLIDFAVRIIKLCSELPKTPAGNHIASQLLRCGTSPAPNYGEARSAESVKDFVHKMRIVIKELSESRVWLTIIERSELLTVNHVAPDKQECEELCKIVGASIKTASSRAKRH